MSEVQVRSSRVSLERGNSPLLYAQRLYVQFLQGLFNFNPANKLVPLPAKGSSTKSPSLLAV